MTTFTIPTAPRGPVWLAPRKADRDDPRPVALVRYFRRGDGTWQNDEGDTLAWPELLALGEVDDEYTGSYDLHSTATPWSVIDGAIFGADGDRIAEVSGTSTSPTDDEALALHIVELVNANARGDSATGFVVEVTAQPCTAEVELARRAQLDSVVVDLVSLWRMVVPERREAVDAECGDLVARLDRVVAEATRLASGR